MSAPKIFRAWLESASCIGICLVGRASVTLNRRHSEAQMPPDLLTLEITLVFLIAKYHLNPILEF